MKKFLVKILLFALCFLCILCMVELGIRYIPNSYKIKHAGILNNSNKIETLFLGNSHVYYGVCARDIEKSYNLANVSQMFKYDFLLLNKYIDECCNLKRIILPISYCSLFDPVFEKSEEWWRIIYYTLYMGVEVKPYNIKYYSELSYAPALREKIKAYVRNSSIDCDLFGFGLDFKLESRSKDWFVATERVEKQTFYEWNYLGENIDYLDNIIKLCKQRNIEVILITFPVWHTFYDNLYIKQLEKIYEVVEVMKKKYGVKYYDYLKDKRFVEYDFFDSDHLSDVGAKKMTLILKNEVLISEINEKE